MDKKERTKYNKQYYIKHREKLLADNKKWRKDNPEKESEHHKRYYNNNKEKMLAYNKQWQKDNPEKIKNNHKKYRENNAEKIVIRRTQYMKNRNKIDLKFNLKNKISRAMRKSLKGNKNGRPWEKLVDYTIDNLINRLKQTIPKGYTWNDFLQGKLHIDHIVPVSAHNFTKSEHADFKRCYALSNLQLLSAEENRIKRDTLSRPFQPALKL